MQKVTKLLLYLLMLPFVSASAASNKKVSEKRMAAYLMVFHRDDTHSLYMALSRDGYHFTALNNARPVISGDTIAEQRGVRDPHIYRGPDGAFYLVATDLQFMLSERASVRLNGSVTARHTVGETTVDWC